ncbi:Yip1 family protein [Bifidobacterium sp. ESL0784]|uniref:Yip1 family protein n=1 Tax=Bifidobacterium sp. ESL0784 TaxID=2983231 RepID=UPI0023F95DA2|nr:Yip1 family protein [Bifidobacterium sp. ESL0784]MDF7641601.1 Yip1 family protein [Bifidobacterium sp. ESL0784]
MPNRAERRAQAKRNRQGVPQPNQPQNRGRGGLIDEYSLQERSRRLEENGGTEWKPKAEKLAAPAENLDPNYSDPKVMKAPHSLHQWFRIVSWTLIVLSGIAFAVLMWVPKHPLWLIVTVSVIFVVGVLSLFFTAGNYRHNPNLDSNGTAI